VEHFTRTFGFDPVTGAVLIFDKVESSSPNFQKRWNHHMLEKPYLTGFGYTAESLAPDLGGMLDAHVLLPENPNINIIGGPGSEFLVDGKNYDENGKTADLLRNTRRIGVEAGEWRVEISPEDKRQSDIFLVVLVPYGTPDSKPAYQVRKLEDSSRIGCEITFGNRRTIWWFGRREPGPVVEIHTGDGSPVIHDLRTRSPDIDAGVQRIVHPTVSGRHNAIGFDGSLTTHISQVSE
jgi:hypothetical protein